MSYRDVLLAVATYPYPTPTSAIDEAVAISSALGARISALAFEAKIQAPSRMFDNMFLNVAAMAEVEERHSKQHADEILAAFERIARISGIFGSQIMERSLTSEIPNIIVDYAKLRDLTIMPLSEGDGFDQWYAEEVIFGSGRPTIIIPHESKRARGFSLGTVIVAWDFSRQAARAVADALPLLEEAKRVFVVTVANEKHINTQRSGVELTKHLAHHAIEASFESIDADGRGIAETLEWYANKQDADMLVMGAYGHPRIREFVLGGATRSMLLRPPLPILLSH